jgi:hypothetical protein
LQKISIDEVDLLLERDGRFIAIEAKNAGMIDLKNLKGWRSLDFFYNYHCNINKNREKMFLDWLLLWPMIYRNENELADILIQGGFAPEKIQIIYEPFRIHGIAVVRNNSLQHGLPIPCGLKSRGRLCHERGHQG